MLCASGTLRHNSEGGILHSHRRENLKYYTTNFLITFSLSNVGNTSIKLKVIQDVKDIKRNTMVKLHAVPFPTFADFSIIF
jgi:hypothetical protein